MNRIDCRGMSGTEPVLLTEKALSESGNEAVIVLVDNDETLQGIKKLAEIHKREIDSVEIEKAHEILINPASTTEENGTKYHLTLCLSPLMYWAPAMMSSAQSS